MDGIGEGVERLDTDIVVADGRGSVVGGLSQMIVGEMVADGDELSLQKAADHGYEAMAHVLNSSVGGRSGLVGVYVSQQTLQAILANGGINTRIKGIVDPGGQYPDHPQNESDSINFFLIYPKNSKGTTNTQPEARK